MTPRDQLRALFHTAVDTALPDKIVPPHLPPATKGRTVVVGAGKASAAMAAAVEAHMDGPLDGLVITRYDHAVPCDRIEIVEAAHPVPDQAGWDAAARMLALLDGLGPEDRVIALISGGGSSLLTCMPDPLTLDDARALNRALLASGAPIDQMNCIRRHLSRTNGGRLAAAAFPAPMTALMISDVPGDNLLDIASGPTVGDPTTLAEARALAERHALDLTPALRAALNDPANESVKPDDPRLAATDNRLIAAPIQSLEAAASHARALDLDPQIQGDAIEGEARALGRTFAAEALRVQAALAPGAAPKLLLSGGETTVTLPKDGRPLGKGGRNVDFLLGLAEALQGAPGIWALAADTDGVDGAAEVAGAIVAPDTLTRGPDIAKALHAYDGHGYFETLGDQVVTGPTLTNVNDFRAILIHPAS